MELITTVYYSALIVFSYMTALFILAIILKDNSIADIAWGPGFILVAWAAMYANSAFGTRQIMAAVLVTVWGFRLAIRIFQRNAGRGEDPHFYSMVSEENLTRMRAGLIARGEPAVVDFAMTDNKQPLPIEALINKNQ